MIQKLKTNRRFLIFAAILIGMAPFTPEPHLFGKIRWVMGGAVGMQPMDWLDLLFHSAPIILLLLSFIPTEESKKMKAMVKSGECTIIDVRTAAEFSGAHVEGSKNIPVNEIAEHIEAIKSMKMPIVLCCASGIRSAHAASILNKAGIECHNAGTWTNVNAMMD